MTVGQIKSTSQCINATGVVPLPIQVDGNNRVAKASPNEMSRASIGVVRLNLNSPQPPASLRLAIIYNYRMDAAC